MSWPGTRSASHRCSTGLLLQALLSLRLFHGPFFLFWQIWLESSKGMPCRRVPQAPHSGSGESLGLGSLVIGFPKPSIFSLSGPIICLLGMHMWLLSYVLFPLCRLHEHMSFTLAIGRSHAGQNNCPERPTQFWHVPLGLMFCEVQIAGTCAFQSSRCKTPPAICKLEVRRAISWQFQHCIRAGCRLHKCASHS